MQQGISKPTEKRGWDLFVHLDDPSTGPGLNNKKGELQATNPLCRGGKAQGWTALVKDHEESLEKDVAEDLEAGALVGLDATIAYW